MPYDTTALSAKVDHLCLALMSLGTYESWHVAGRSRIFSVHHTIVLQRRCRSASCV